MLPTNLFYKYIISHDLAFFNFFCDTCGNSIEKIGEIAYNNGNVYILRKSIMKNADREDTC